MGDSFPSTSTIRSYESAAWLRIRQPVIGLLMRLVRHILVSDREVVDRIICRPYRRTRAAADKLQRRIARSSRSALPGAAFHAEAEADPAQRLRRVHCLL